MISWAGKDKTRTCTQQYHSPETDRSILRPQPTVTVQLEVPETRHMHGVSGHLHNLFGGKPPALEQVLEETRIIRAADAMLDCLAHGEQVF